ncbi:MAG: hypothetical protein KC414_13930 [Romboutsia sp.]|nr:hypothetical protein [Romboutsia sp.]
MNSDTNLLWGRNSRPDYLTSISTISLMFSAPFIVYLCMIYSQYSTIFLNPINILHFDLNTFVNLGCWIMFQYMLMTIIPCKPSYGSITPGGYKLKYKTNGALALIISIIFYTSTVPSTYIANHWKELFVSANIYGMILAILVYLKGKYYPSYDKDVKITNNVLYDFYMGLELNPRIGNFDLKLFFNGRPGIIGWVLINLSFMSKQLELNKSISNGMILVNLLQLLYVVDFFYNEDWYLRTIDIAHDHFGWMLSWGDLVWLPFMYTLQAQYLAYYPDNMSNINSLLVCILGLLGYVIFRLANYQKDTFRNEMTDDYIPSILGISELPKFLVVNYTSADGVVHNSNLLLSGLWGWSRHANYLGDLILSLCYGLSCGFDSLIPYIYFIYMTILLIHRCFRDEDRLTLKYGEGWKRYTNIVKYRLIPYIF